MTVNTVPFAPILRIYPGGNPADASTWGVGADISTRVRYPGSEGGREIAYQAGRPDEAGRVDPGQMTLTLENSDGAFSTTNPNSPYYGLLRRGTPITLGMLCGEDDFSRTVSGGLGTSSGGGAWTSTAIWSTDGSSGQAAIPVPNFASVPLLAGADAANVDGRVTVWPTVAATGAALVYGMRARVTDSNNSLIFAVEFSTGGNVDIRIRREIAGSATPLVSSTGFGTYVANDKWRMRWQCDGPSLRLKAWAPANPADPDADEPDAWSLTTTDTLMTDAGTGLFFWRVVGNTNAGTVNFKFSDYSVEAIEFTGTVIKWPVNWDKSSNVCWAPIQAAGILRRLQQGGQPLRSPLTRQLSGYAHTGYWPLEDGSEATLFGSLTTGVKGALKTAEVTPAGDSTLAGASVSATFASAGATIRGFTPRRQTGTGFAAMFLMKLQSLPAAKTRVASWASSGRVVAWNVYIDSVANITIEGLDSSDAIVVNVSNAMTIDPTEWVAYQLEAETSGGTVSWAHTFHLVGSTDYLSQASTYASSVTSRLWAFQLGGASVDLSGAAFAHVWIGENTLPFVDDTFSQVSDGYRGELASARIARLCDEEGIPVAVEPGDSEPLGPQRSGTLVDLLNSAADADYGILHEAGSGLGYRPRSARYSREVSMALTVAAGEIDDPPDPVDDDQRVRNDWTVSRDDGAFAQAIDQDHIDAEGRYSDSATLNVATDNVLPDHAGWRLYLGTRQELRWPDLSINFAHSPDLIPTWRAAPFGLRLTVVTGLTQVASSDPDVIVEGFQCSLWPHGWKAKLNCSSAKPWDQVALDGGLRLDTDGSTLDPAGAGVNTTATSWVVVTTSGPIWAPTSILPAEVPFTIVCEGEEVSVTDVGDLTAGKQTLTVVRSTNGIVKAHAAGAAIGLAIPTYLAL